MSDDKQSHWGWGWAERFGDADQRRALGQMAEAMLGVQADDPTDPVALSDILIPDSSMNAPGHLADSLSDDATLRIRHTYGRSFPEIWRGFKGDFDTAPDLVAHPRHEADLHALMRWAEDASIALVPYGGGTSVVGGVTPQRLAERYTGWVSVDLANFDGVGPVDVVDRTARIEAGARGPTIEERLHPHGLTLRHFPQSFEFSTLGGWLATRAGGHFTTNYTRIDDLVQSIRMVTPAGI